MTEDVLDRGNLERMSPKALMDLAIVQASQVDLLRLERNEESYRQAASRHRILVLLTEHAGCLDGQTGLSVILSSAVDRAILTHMGLIAALQKSDIPDALLRQTRHLHVASYFLQTDLQTGLPDLFRCARESGLTTSLDTNYDPSEKWIGFDELLSVTNVFLPNKKEAVSLSGKESIELAADRLGSGSKH